MGSGFPEVFLLLPSLLQDRVNEASLAIDFVYLPKSISEKRDGEGQEYRCVYRADIAGKEISYSRRGTYGAIKKSGINLLRERSARV